MEINGDIIGNKRMKLSNDADHIVNENGDTIDQQMPDVVIQEQNDNMDSNNVDDVVRTVHECLSKVTNLSNLEKVLTIVQSRCLNEANDLYFYFDSVICQYYLGVLVEAIAKPKVFQSIDLFNEILEKYQKWCLDYYQRELCEKSFYQNHHQNKTSERRIKLLETINEMSQGLSRSLRLIEEDNFYSLTSAPIALKTLLALGLTFFSFKKNLILLRNIFEILHDRKNRRLLCDNPEWKDLENNAQLCIWIDCNLKAKRSEDVAHFTLFLVNMGIETDQFGNMLSLQAIKELASSLKIKILDLFIHFQTEISRLLIDKLKQNFDPDLLYKCMKIFSCKSLTDELIRWILPVFVSECNDNSRRLLDNILQDHQNAAAADLIKQYFKYILMYLFYDCQASVQKIHQVLQFLSDYSQQNIFSLIRRRSKYLVDAFLSHISKNRDMTLRALSLIVMASDVEPDQLPENMLRFDLERFNQNEEIFLIFLKQKCQIFFHSLVRLLNKNSSFSERMILIDSFGIILRQLDITGINKHRVMIYFIIRQILSEPYQSSYLPLLQTGLSILDHFIERVDETFFQHQSPISICLIVLPLVKRFPKEVQMIVTIHTFIRKVLLRNQCWPNIYYQLNFLLQDSLKSIHEFINRKLNELVSTTQSTGMMPLCAIIDANNNPEQEPIITGLDEKILIQSAELIEYVQSPDFTLRCQEIRCLMENIEIRGDELQGIILGQLFMRLKFHREAFNRICVKRSGHLDELFEMLEIELRIESKKISLVEFIREIFLRLFHCLKFSICTKVRMLAGNCLGILGAINVEMLRFDRPVPLSSMDVNPYKSIDFCNLQLFQPKKKKFKFLVLNTLMNMVPTCQKLSDYNCVNHALKETLWAFANEQNAAPLLIGNEQDDGTGGLVSTQQIDRFVQNHYGKRSANTRGSLPKACSQEVEQLDKSDQIRKYLQNEKNEPLDLDQDLIGELRLYRHELELSSYNMAEAPERHPLATMEQFFELIRPSLQYHYFVRHFIRMLYFLVGSTTDETNSLNGNSNPDRLTSEVVENILSQSSQLTGNRCPVKVLDKLSRLATPARFFSVCRLAILRNFKLAHLLLPSLIVMSLGRTTDQIREEFASKFQRMIREQFIENTEIFHHELGIMGSELICCIYDYLRIWFENRQLAHQVIILTQAYDSKYTVTIGKQMDQEYHGVKMIMDSVDNVTMSRLACKARSFWRALQYLEQSFEDGRKSKTMTTEEHIRNNESLYLDIYHGLNDPALIRGLTAIIDKPSAKHLLHQYILEPDPIGQSICDVELVKSKIGAAFDLEEKNIIVRPNSSIETSRTMQYKLESAWRLNSWEIIDAAMVSNNNFQGISNFGRILWSMRQKETPVTVENIVADVQQSFLAPLNAALFSNTETAYGRAYQTSLIPLHILHDIQQFISDVYKPLLLPDDHQTPSSSVDIESSSDRILKQLQELIQCWRIRNRLLPEGLPRQQVLDVQRSLIEVIENSVQLSNVRTEIFRYWQQSIRSYLDSGCVDRAQMAWMKAMKCYESCESGIQSSISEQEHLDYVLDAAKVVWIKKGHTQSIQLIRYELEQRYDDIREYCYSESLRGYTQHKDHPDVISLVKWLRIKPLDQVMILSDPPQHFKLERLNNFGRLQLCYAHLCEQSRSINSIALKALYKAATVACPQWEESHFQLGMFYHRLYRESQNSSQLLQSKTDFNLGKPQEIAEYKSLVIQSLCQSLQFGTLKYVRISLSILLNIWVDLGYEFVGVQRKQTKLGSGRLSLNNENSYQECLQRILDSTVKYVRQMLTKVNDAIFMVELDMLIAHLLHPHPPISDLIKEILVRLIVAFPHHMVWFLSRPMNTRRFNNAKITEMIRLANGKNSSVSSYFEKFRHFSQRLISLANYKPRIKSNAAPQDSGITEKVSLKMVNPELILAIQNGNVRFAFPCNQILLPNALNLERLSQKDSFDNHFRGLFIEGVENEISVMRSLQRPKKMTFICHDGSRRTVLVKDHDDLRKDRAYLNFANLFNQCYRGDIKAVEPMSSIDKEYDMATEMKIIARLRQNPLSVKTYVVMPLTSSCGLIEWIPGLQSLKALVEGEYMKTRAQSRSFLSARAAFIKSAMHAKSKQKRIELFQKFYPMFQPAVFQNWFYETYPDGYSWYMAQRNFTRTTAVFSIIGYILGQGDRHSDNILLEPATGQVVQVDFNCLLNQGESFQVPECVPFRLTQNIIAAMGSQGYDGLFRQTCEDVLLVLRHHRQLFTNEINIFLYDALDEWLNDRSVSRPAEIAQKSVFNVEARLFGIVGRSDQKLPRGNPLSIQGQVDYLIKEATDINNLGSMFYGWASYL